MRLSRRGLVGCGRIPTFRRCMERPQVADGSDGLQIWRVAANMLNKQSETSDKGWSSSLVLGEGLTTPGRKKRIHKMEAAKSSETLTSYDITTRRHNPDDLDLNMRVMDVRVLPFF